MLTRCVVLVDAAYVRAAAANQLTDDPQARVVVSDTGALVHHLRALAEDVTGEDLLRVYWYEPAGTTQAEAEHLATQAYLTVRAVSADESLDAQSSPLARDLTTLLTHLACGDVVICTGDPSLAPLFALAQDHCRHVHWLQLGESEDPATAPLWVASDTRQYLSHAVLTQAFRIASPSERRLAPATHSTTMVSESNALATDSQARPGVSPARRGSGALDLGEGAPRRRSAQRPPVHALAPPAPASFAPSPDAEVWDDDPFARPRRAAAVPVTRAPSVMALDRASPPPRVAHQAPRVAVDASAIADDDLAVLHTVAAQIADELGPHDAATVRVWERGVPSEVDRQLLGASYAAFGRRLVQAEKVLLRRLFVAACEGQASVTGR